MLKITKIETSTTLRVCGVACGYTIVAGDNPKLRGVVLKDMPGVGVIVSCPGRPSSIVPWGQIKLADVVETPDAPNS